MSGPRRRWAARGLVAVLALGMGLVAGAPAANAAVPDAHGFVLYNFGSVVPSGTWPAGTTVVTGVPGRYRVIFPGQAAHGGVVHVTAVNGGAPYYCVADGWGPSGVDEIVGVSCYKAGGVLVPTGFTVHFASSSHPAAALPGQYAYVDANPAGVPISVFNSSAGPSGVTHVGIGKYLVRFSGLGGASSPTGSWQATAVSPNVAAHCNIARFFTTATDQLAYVFCWDAVGAPFDTRFTASFQAERALWGPAYPPKYFGYLWFVPGVGPPPTNFNSVLGFGVNTVTAAGPNLWLVTFPRLAQRPDDVQVTAFTTGSDFCGLITNWSYSGTGDVIVRDVDCFTVAGAPSPSAGFLISYTSEF